MRGTDLKKLLSTVSLIFFTSAANAEVYLCEDTAGVFIDKHGISTSEEEINDFDRQEWIVDTERGWRRADIPQFRGSCESNKGYIVCRIQDIVFGEATFTIYPSGANFVLVYLDYGLDALTFVGKCVSDTDT